MLYFREGFHFIDKKKEDRKGCSHLIDKETEAQREKGTLLKVLKSKHIVFSVMSLHLATLPHLLLPTAILLVAHSLLPCSELCVPTCTWESSEELLKILSSPAAG